MPKKGYSAATLALSLCCDATTDAALRSSGPSGWIVDAIDRVTEVVAGDRRQFHQASPRTPGPDLPPVKWRTVE